MRNRSLLVCLLPLFAGCGDTAGPTLLTPSSFTVFSGCADVRLFARNDGDTAALFVQLPAGLIDQAHEMGGETAFVFGLPSPDLPRVQVQEGHRVSTLECTDVVSGGLPHVDRTWTATGGTISGTITGSGNGSSPATGVITLELTDLVLESGDRVLELGPITFSGIQVGWLPG